MNDKTRYIRRLYVFVAAVLIAILSRSALTQPTQNENDEAVIRALVDKINQAWLSEKPSILFQEILSDKGCVVALPKGGNLSEAVILNKQKFCELLDNTMQSQQRPQKHEHKVESITITGPLAYEIGDVLDITADGSQRHSKILNFFAKDETGWKLIHSTPADNIRKAFASDVSQPLQDSAARVTAQQPTDKDATVSAMERLAKIGKPTHSGPNDTPKTQNLSAEQTKNLDEYIRGSFSGIGVGIDTHPNGIYIKNVISGGPADNAGINGGEIITAINGESTVGMPLERAVSLIKGPEGTSVDLKILLSGGTQRDVSVVRGTVVIAGVENRILEPNIGLLVISSFNQETAAKVRDALMYFQQQNIRGLVLDLRNNKGGSLPAVKEITSMFTGPDQIMWYAQYTGQAESTPEKGTVQKMVQWPVVVLINSETMCGGELLAAALKSKGDAKLLGQKTYGEGSVGRLESQADGSSKKIPTGYFYTADGQAIDKQGINPDKELDPKLSSEEALKQAVDELTREVENRK